MKNITPRINTATEKYLQQNFKTLNSGAEFVLEAVPAVARIYTGYELKGKFIAGELKLMLDVMNGMLLTGQLAGRHLPLSVQDGIALDGLDKKWEVDAEQLLEKLKNMSTAELFFLEIWIQGFWQQSDTVTLEEYIKELL